MIERLFAISGTMTTVLLAGGVAALWLRPGSRLATTVVQAGLILLMLTPVTRVMVACVRSVRAGDRLLAALTAAILAVLALSAWAARG